MLRFRLMTVAAVGIAMLGCAAQQTATNERRSAMLVGADASGARVLIKSVDGGPTLWAQPGALGTRVTIAPGHHKVAVMCQFGAHFVDGELTIDVQPGRTYDLTASAPEGNNACNVTAASRS
jgi:hypothetical protein